MIDLNEQYDEVLAKVMDDFKDLNPEAQNYSEVARVVINMYEAHLKEVELSDDRAQKQFERGADSERIAHEDLLEEKKFKGEFILKCIDVLRTAMLVIANGSDMNRIMKFEETGHFAKSFAFNKLMKLHPKN